MIEDNEKKHGPLATVTYRVAGHLFAVRMPQAVVENDGNLMAAYRPFVAEADGEDPLFRLDVLPVGEVEVPADFKEDTRQDEEGQIIASGNLADGSKAIAYEWGGEKAFVYSSPDYREATLSATDGRLQHAVDNTLMLLFAFATAPLSTLLFHSSTIVWQRKAYMFLGVSGTGKSTHSRLWLKNVKDTFLLNDDNPVVRIDKEGTPVVYGSPWSGKTPCYKNDQYPLGAIVKLHQAPANHIRKANLLEAYAAITESVSGKRWEKAIADGLHNSTEAILKKRDVFVLHCLPDDDAALVCWNRIANQGEGGRP